MGRTLGVTAIALEEEDRMSFIRIGQHEVNPDYIQYVHDNDQDDYTAYISVGEHAAKVPVRKDQRPN